MELVLSAPALPADVALERRRQWNRNNAAKSRARQKYLLACVAERTEQLVRENRLIATLLSSAGYELTPEQLETTSRTAEAVASADVSKFMASARAGGDSLAGLTIPTINSGQLVVDKGRSVKFNHAGGLRGGSESEDDLDEAARLYGARSSNKSVRRSGGPNDANSSAGSHGAIPALVAATLADEDFQVVQVVATCKQHFIITNACQVDNPITFASRGFWELTGYAPSELLGRNCRFLQGPETDPRAIRMLGDSVRAGQDVQVILLNYRKDGTRFWNYLYMSPLRDTDGRVLYFIGVQSNVSSACAKPLLLAQEAQFAAEAAGIDTAPPPTRDAPSQLPAPILEVPRDGSDKAEEEAIDRLIAEHGGPRRLRDAAAAAAAAQPRASAEAEAAAKAEAAAAEAAETSSLAGDDL